MKQNTLYIIVASLIVAAGASWYFFTGTGNDEPLTATDTTNAAQAQFECLLAQHPISLDTMLFYKPNFQGLVSINTTISPEETGRPDPFAPIAGIVKAPATTK